MQSGSDVRKIIGMDSIGCGPIPQFVERSPEILQHRVVDEFDRSARRQGRDKGRNSTDGEAKTLVVMDDGVVGRGRPAAVLRGVLERLFIHRIGPRQIVQLFTIGEMSSTKPQEHSLDTALYAGLRIALHLAIRIHAGRARTLMGSTGDLVTTHPLDPDDASIIGGIRAAVRAQKGAPWRIEARRFYDALLEGVSPRDDVAFESATVGGVPGVWVRPASSRSDEAVLHVHGGWFVSGSATAYRHLVGHIAART